MNNLKQTVIAHCRDKKLCHWIETGECFCDCEECTKRVPYDYLQSSPTKPSGWREDFNEKLHKLVPYWVDLIQAHENHQLLCSRQAIVNLVDETIRSLLRGKAGEIRGMNLGEGQNDYDYGYNKALEDAAQLLEN